MAPSGRKPKPRGQAVTRHQPAYGWIDVDSTPFDGGPELPARRRNGTPWPDWVSETWDAWSTMPHARLWREADWAFALDTIELVAVAFAEDAKVGLFTELRYREKVMGTTWSARQDMRIRYNAPASPHAAPGGVTSIDQYRNL